MRVHRDLLLSAAAQNDLNLVRHLIENNKVPPTHGNGIGQTALHVAAMWGHVDVARYLIQAGANGNAANQLTRATPLHTALFSHKTSAEQQAELAQLLVEEAQVDPVQEDSYGKAPIEYIHDQMDTHPLFRKEHASLLTKLTPPPPSMDRLREGMLKQIARAMPTCAKIAK